MLVVQVFWPKPTTDKAKKGFKSDISYWGMLLLYLPLAEYDVHE